MWPHIYRRIILYCLVGLQFIGAINSESACNFNGYVAMCDIVLHQEYDIRVSASINPCSTPVDITFQIWNSNYSVDWKHTFVNTDETQHIYGFSSDVAIRVELIHLSKENLRVEAYFIVDSEMSTPPLIDSKITIERNGCYFVGGKGGQVVLAVFILLLVLIIVMVGVFVFCRRRRARHKRPSNALIDNMEGPGIGKPYQESPALAYSDDNPFRGGTNTIGTTVIENSLTEETQHALADFSKGARPKTRPAATAAEPLNPHGRRLPSEQDDEADINPFV